MKTTTKLFFAAMMLATSLTLTVQAGTIGYWRFENAGNLGLDSSGNGRDLTPQNSPTSTNLPATGSGGACQYFSKTIPQTLQTNTLGARLGTTSYFSRANEAAFGVTTQFTVEAFCNLSTVAAGVTYPIASRWSQTGSGVVPISWVLAVRKDAGGIIRLRMTGSADASTGFALITSNLSLTLNTDYYIAFVFNAGTVTFYAADMSAPTPVLQSETNLLKGVGGTTMTSLTNTATTFRVGAFQSAASTFVYLTNSLLDEVRFADRALPVGELLFSPASLPGIVIAPQNFEGSAGNNASFSVTASGTPPLYYQWYAGSSPITSATNSSLVVSNLTPAQSGNIYSVVVTNFVGSVTSTPPAVLTILNVSSPTVGYWRFEDPANLGLDSSTNAIALTTNGAPVGVALPDALSGAPGALFPKTIPPLSGQTNIGGLQLDGASLLRRAAGAAVLMQTQFTAEVFFNVSSVPASTTIPLMSQWNEFNNQSGWMLAVREQTAGVGDLHLRFVASQTGSPQIATNSQRWVLSANKDYYAAVTFNAGTVTFYLADLSSTNPVLESETIVGSITNIYNTSADFRVGAFQNGTTSITNLIYFSGLMDEARLSRVAVAPAALLYPPPAPPLIDLAPKDVAVAEHDNATFTTTASGQQPFSYQWYVGTTPITSATNTTLILTNVSLAQNGTLYSVVVTNSVGSVTSAPAMLTVVDVSGPTIGYWRFENPDDIGLDSSGSGLELTNFGSSASATLPDSSSGSPGALFAKTIPQTGQTNINALSLDGGSYLFRSDYPSLTVRTQFTAEVYFNARQSYYGTLMPLVSDYDEPGNKRSWLLGVKEQTAGVGDLRLTLNVSRDGSATAGTNFWSGTATRWVLTPGNDYYAAVTFNAGSVTFYLADLSSTNPVLESQTLTATATTVFDTSADFRIGGYKLSSGSPSVFPGLVDEVRVSRVALDSYSLLVPPPDYPVIQTAPQDTAVAPNTDASFSIAATGKPALAYQWYSGTSRISGATNTTLTVSNVSLAQSGNLYQVVVTNSYGSVTSAPAMLWVNATVGYWRFENQADLGLDLSGNDLELTNSGSPAGMTLSDAGSGNPGAFFSKTILLTGQTNTSALQLDGTSAYLFRSDSFLCNVKSQLTVEGFFNMSSVSNNTYPIASQYSDVNNQRSWVFGVREDTGGTPRLRLTMTQDGTLNTGEYSALFATSWAIQTKHDYYAAVVYNAGNLKFYLADLSSTNPVLNSQSITGLVTSVFDTTADLRVGGWESVSAGNIVYFPGLLDEVRVHALRFLRNSYCFLKRCRVCRRVCRRYPAIPL
jgi:hypothetical protein